MASSKVVVTTNPDVGSQSSISSQVWDEVVGGTQSQDMAISIHDLLLNSVPRNDAAPSHGGRGKRKAVEEAVMDRATLQKQRRMIKNRESAARSRERKQVLFLFLFFVQFILFLNLKRVRRVMTMIMMMCVVSRLIQLS